MSQENSSNSTPQPYPDADSSEQIGKVSEIASAAYAVRTDAKWIPPAQTIAGLAADDEVWTFVKANDLLSHLETAIQLVRQTFFDVREMRLSYEPDPELPKFNSIVIWAKAPGTVEELFEQEKKYTREFVEAVPPDRRHQIGLFLGVA
jgi:hypothetical protein